MRTRNINFRETKSERSATRSYRDFGKYIRETLKTSFIKEKYQKLKGKNISRA